MTINTKRLILRPWTKENLEPFAKLNADARVREFFPELLSRQESDASVKLVSEHIQRCGWGFWAASLVEIGEFIGFIGLEDVYFSAPFNKSSPEEKTSNLILDGNLSLEEQEKQVLNALPHSNCM